LTTKNKVYDCITQWINTGNKYTHVKKQVQKLFEMVRKFEKNGTTYKRGFLTSETSVKIIIKV